MELIKRNIHMNKLKSEVEFQITLDDDFNISDTKPDVERIIKDQGNIIITETKVLQGKVNVKGMLEFTLLYFGSNNEINSMKGKVSFDENINMDNVDTRDIVNLKYELEDLSTMLINSRKISIKSLITLKCIAEEIYDEETAISVGSDDDIKTISKTVDITQIAINKKDIFRINENIVLPANKKNILELIFSDVTLLNTDFRLMDGSISIKGEIMVFAIYLKEEGDFDYIEKEIPFSGSMELSDCNSDMIENIGVVIGNRTVNARPDEDGEERIIEVEVILDVDIKVYSEEEIEIIKDIYSLNKDLRPLMKNADYECIRVKNSSKCRVSDRLKLDNIQPEVLQICNSTASVKIDEMEIVDDGISVDGAIVVQILYITEDDMMPLNSINAIIPYSQIIEVKDIREDSIFDITPTLEHIGVMMLGNREFEVKCVVDLNTIVFDRIIEPIISDIEEEDIDMEQLQKMPGIIGYIVKDGDTLWSIAKKFHSTVDRIRETNSFDKEDVSLGDKLLIIKQVSCN